MKLFHLQKYKYYIPIAPAGVFDDLLPPPPPPGSSGSGGAVAPTHVPGQAHFVVRSNSYQKIYKINDE